MAPAALAVVAAIAVGVFLTEESRKNYIAGTQNRISSELNLLRTRLEGTIDANLRRSAGSRAAIHLPS